MGMDVNDDGPDNHRNNLSTENTEIISPSCVKVFDISPSNVL